MFVLSLEYERTSRRQTRTSLNWPIVRISTPTNTALVQRRLVTTSCTNAVYFAATDIYFLPQIRRRLPAKHHAWILRPYIFSNATRKFTSNLSWSISQHIWTNAKNNGSIENTTENDSNCSFMSSSLKENEEEKSQFDICALLKKITITQNQPVIIADI